MTAYQDLADAEAFHRRRLVRAFVSGGRAGRNGEPPSSARCVVGGLVLAAITLAATIAGSTLTGHPTLEWGHGLDGGGAAFSPPLAR
jgi:hypothetical protein